MSQSRSVSIISTFEAERNSLEDFAAERARGFVGRQAVIERLTGLVSPPRKRTRRGASVSPASRVRARARCSASCFAA